MDEPILNLTLIGPAKIDGKIEPPGKTVKVSHTLALQLAASGVVSPEMVSALGRPLSEVAALDFDGAVAEVQRQADERAAAFEADFAKKIAAATAALAGACDERDRAEARLASIDPLYTEALGKIDDLTARLAEAEARASKAETALAELSAKGGDGGATDQPEGGETPPADGAANTQKAAKKATAGKT